jgi:hypothetical protein
MRAVQNGLGIKTRDVLIRGVIDTSSGDSDHVAVKFAQKSARWGQVTARGDIRRTRVCKVVVGASTSPDPRLTPFSRTIVRAPFRALSARGAGIACHASH